MHYLMKRLTLKHIKLYSSVDSICVAESCLASKNLGYKEDGVYQVEIAGVTRNVFCDMKIGALEN